MARKKVESTLLLTPQIIAQITESVSELLTAHASDIEEAIDDSDDRCLKVNLSADMDASESAPNVDVTIRFSSSVTDRRTIRCEDPKQGTFKIMSKEELDAEKTAQKEEKAASKKSKKKKAADEETANSGESESE